MEQLKKLFSSLSLKQKISIAITALVILTGIYNVAKWRKEEDFKPLYTGVAAEDAAAIMQKLKESGVEYRLSDSGGVISVPSEKVAELRLEMAAIGLPKTGRIGFELFDKTNFGATEFVEHVNYNRALEGELERSINSLTVVEQARVHLTAAKDSVFVESREQAKASVVIKLKPGEALLPRNVTAIQQLVASAVGGLNSEDVAVVDTHGNLLSRRKIAEDDSSDAAFERRQRLEHDYLEKINTTLEPLLGRDKFRAGVTVDCDLISSEQSEETFDPTKSVMTNSQKTEEVTAGSGSAGIPGTATNLPRPAVRTGGPTSTTSRRTENISYQSSHLLRKSRIPEGGIKHLSVAVLLDQRVHWEGKGNTKKLVAVPPTPEMIKTVHDLVAGVTGFTQERGDQITVESLPFEATLEQQESTGPNGGGVPGKLMPVGWKEYLRNPMVLISAGVGALLVVLLGAAAMFFLKGKKADVQVGTSRAVEGGGAQAAIGAGSAAPSDLEAALAQRIDEQKKADMAALAAIKLPTVTTKKGELLANEIRESAKTNASVPAHVLQTWLHEND